jgi:hypothetical protein
MVKGDGSVKIPISALRFIPRDCGVRLVRLISRDLQALISAFLRSRWKFDFYGLIKGKGLYAKQQRCPMTAD